jgi:hypothetical protein
MGEGENQHVIGFLDVDHRVGEAGAKVSPSLGPESPVNPRVGANFLNEPIHFGCKFPRQGPALALVILGPPKQIRFRLGMEPKWLHDP